MSFWYLSRHMHELRSAQLLILSNRVGILFQWQNPKSSRIQKGVVHIVICKQKARFCQYVYCPNQQVTCLTCCIYLSSSFCLACFKQFKFFAVEISLTFLNVVQMRLVMSVNKDFLFHPLHIGVFSAVACSQITTRTPMIIPFTKHIWWHRMKSELIFFEDKSNHLQTNNLNHGKVF